MKKFSLFILCCFMPTIANSAPKTTIDNTDVGAEHATENAQKSEAQPVINSEINQRLPNTNEKTAFMPNINSRNENGWGEQKNEPFTLKKFTLFNGTKRPDGNENFYNCPTSDNKNYCQPVKGKLNQELGIILREDKATLDENGFIKDIQTPVLYDQGGKIGNNDLKKYFYRFWNNKCETNNQQSCWSPSYPIICNANFDYTEFEKLKNDKNGAEKARHYFGWKEKLNEDINSYTNNNDYKVHVFMAPFKKNYLGVFEEDTDSGIFTTLSPTGWKINGNCLDPEFDYDLTSSDNNGDTTTETLVTNDQTSSLSEPKKINKGAQILPCGSFSDNSAYKNKSFKEIAVKSCTDKYYSIVSNLIYKNDEYIIHMPLSSKFTDINTLKPTKKDNETLEEYIKRIANYYDLTNSTKKMRTRICGTCEKNIDDFCEEIVRGVLFEKCTYIENKDKFKCTEPQLDSVIHRLKFDKPGNFTGMIEGNKISGYTKLPMKCEICLYNLDIILSGGKRNGKTYNGLLLIKD